MAGLSGTSECGASPLDISGGGVKSSHPTCSYHSFAMGTLDQLKLLVDSENDARIAHLPPLKCIVCKNTGKDEHGKDIPGKALEVFSGSSPDNLGVLFVLVCCALLSSIAPFIEQFYGSVRRGMHTAMAGMRFDPSVIKGRFLQRRWRRLRPCVAF